MSYKQGFAEPPMIKPPNLEQWLVFIGVLLFMGILIYAR